MLHALGALLTGAAAAYAIVAWAAVLRHRQEKRNWPSPSTPVTILKPLCGLEANLEANLRSFCVQSYPEYQIVCGVSSPNDPAVPIVRRLQRDFPHRAIDLVIDGREHGTNRKVSNLINLLPLARHGWLVMADSDISVPDDYLARVVAPLADSGVGIVTCLYRARAAGGRWSGFSGRFIDEWFTPSVCVSHLLGSNRFAFGATLALRRAVLHAAGNFEAVKDVLADDYWLGEVVRAQGLRTVLSDLVVTTDVTETGLRQAWAHEFRWMQTISTAQPLGFAGAVITFTFPLLALGLCLAPDPIVLVLAVVGASARLLLFAAQSTSARPGSWWGAALMTPVRDTVLLAEWIAAQAGAPVRWRGQVFDRQAQRRAPALPGVAG